MRSPANKEENEPSLWPALAYFIAAGAFYTSFAARAALWGDSAKLSLYLLERDFGDRAIRSGRHFLTLLGGDIFSRLMDLSPHMALSVFSAACGAGTVGLLYVLIIRMTGSARAASLGACALLFSHTHVFCSTIQESYAPAYFLWAALLILVHSMWARPSQAKSLAAGALLGLSLINHPLNVIAFGLGVFPLLACRAGWKETLKHIPAASAGVLLGLIPLYVYARPVAAQASAAQIVSGDFHGSLSHFFVLNSFFRGLALFAPWALWQLPVPVALCAWLLLQRRTAGASGILPHLAAAAVIVLFASTYMLQRRYLFWGLCLPNLIAVVMALSAPWLERQARIPVAAAFILLIPVVNLGSYRISSELIGEHIVKTLQAVRVTPWRSVKYYIWPLQHRQEGPMALMRALESLPEPGRPRALITDFTFLRPLLYYQKRGGWMPSLSLEELDAFYWLPTREKRDARMEELLCRARQQDRQMLVLDPTDRYLKNLGLENRGSFSPYGPFFEFKPAAGSLRCPL